MVRGWYRGEMEGPMLAEARLAAPPFDIEVRGAGIGGKRQEAVSSTSCVSAAMVQIMFVRLSE